MKTIELTHGQVSKVSDDWFEYLSQWKWNAFWNKNTNSYYAVRSEGKSPNQYKIWMHKVISNTHLGVMCDHKNRDTLDNQPNNLRSCTVSQNNMNVGIRKNNTSGYKGVSKCGKKWRAAITFGGKGVSLKCWDNPEDAARAYDEAAKIYHGEFAFLNFSNLRYGGD